MEMQIVFESDIWKNNNSGLKYHVKNVTGIRVYVRRSGTFVVDAVDYDHFVQHHTLVKRNKEKKIGSLADMIKEEAKVYKRDRDTIWITSGVLDTQDDPQQPNKQQKGDTVAHDPVNHPKHYTSDPSGVECIQITRHRNFNIGNAIKYLWRNGLKDGNSNIQDLKKAAWYIQDEINRLEKGE